MIQASICTIGDEILIGQVVDTNSSLIARALEEAGIRVRNMVSIGDDRDEILSTLRREAAQNSIVITTGGLGPTKDDITKAVLGELSGSTAMVEDPRQSEIVKRILASRGLDMLEINRRQAFVPDTCKVIPNKLGTAPIMVFSLEGGATLYALPGVPHEAAGAIPDIIADIKGRYTLTDIFHRSIMVYGMAESALSELIAPWEDALPADMHLAYLPDPLKGIRLRLSIYSGTLDDEKARVQQQLEALKEILGDRIYSLEDDTLEATIGRIFRSNGLTLAAAESCTGGEIAHLITTIDGASEYFLGSVTSYAVKVKEEVLGVPAGTIEEFGVVSSEVAAAMASGVRNLLGSDYAVATTGLAGAAGDGRNPGGTVWIGVAGPRGIKTQIFSYKNDRKRNIERFAATALNFLREFVLSDLNN